MAKNDLVLGYSDSTEVYLLAQYINNQSNNWAYDMLGANMNQDLLDKLNCTLVIPGWWMNSNVHCTLWCWVDIHESKHCHLWWIYLLSFQRMALQNLWGVLWQELIQTCIQYHQLWLKMCWKRYDNSKLSENFTLHIPVHSWALVFKFR